MPWVDAIEMGLCVFVAIGGGIYVGAWFALGMAGQFVDETLTACESVFYKALANPTVQAAIKAAEKLPNVGGKGGFMDKIAKFLGRMVGG